MSPRRAQSHCPHVMTWTKIRSQVLNWLSHTSTSQILRITKNVEGRLHFKEIEHKEESQHSELKENNRKIRWLFCERADEGEELNTAWLGWYAKGQKQWSLKVFESEEVIISINVKKEKINVKKKRGLLWRTLSYFSELLGHLTNMYNVKGIRSGSHSPTSAFGFCPIICYVNLSTFFNLSNVLFPV